MMHKITVVVPIYNVRKYLARCVDSILQQTYKNLEIFLVDDGSQDNCPAMCDDYAAKDTRIRVIHKKNGGLSDARNAAINIATGDYIVCIDSDDYVEADMVELLYTTLIQNNCDISTIRYKSFSDGDNAPVLSPENTQHVLSSEDALKNMLYQKTTANSAWGKLYKAELFKDIRYPFGKICEDLGTTYKLFSTSKKIVLNTAVKYHYLQREDSIINAHFSPSRMDALDLAEEQLHYIETHHPNVVCAAKNRLFMEALYIAIEIPKGSTYRAERSRCYTILRSLSHDVANDTDSKQKFRIYAAIATINVHLLMSTFHSKKAIRKIKNKLTASA